MDLFWAICHGNKLYLYRKNKEHPIGGLILYVLLNGKVNF